MSIQITTLSPNLHPNKEVTCQAPPGVIFIGQHIIPDKEFAELVYYWLTNTDLITVDPRLTLLAKIAELNVIPGHNPGVHCLGDADKEKFNISLQRLLKRTDNKVDGDGGA